MSSAVAARPAVRGPPMRPTVSTGPSLTAVRTTTTTQVRPAVSGAAARTGTSSTAPRTASTRPAAGSGASSRNGASPGVSSKGSASSSASSSAGPGRSSTGAGKAPAGDKISNRLNPKTVDFFKESSSAKKSQFESVYSNGGIPCRLVHGSVKHKIQWDSPPETLAYDTVLLHIAEGLRETVHPYNFIARNGFRELMEAPGAAAKVSPLLPRVVASLRLALTSDNKDVFVAGLDGLAQCSNTVGAELTPHLKLLLPPLSKRLMDKTLRDRITDVLNALEGHGGREALAVIKSKIPTYLPLC